MGYVVSCRPIWGYIIRLYLEKRKTDAGKLNFQNTAIVPCFRVWYPKKEGGRQTQPIIPALERCRKIISSGILQLTLVYIWRLSQEKSKTEKKGKRKSFSTHTPDLKLLHYQDMCLCVLLRALSLQKPLRSASWLALLYLLLSMVSLKLVRERTLSSLGFYPFSLFMGLNASDTGCFSSSSFLLTDCTNFQAFGIHFPQEEEPRAIVSECKLKKGSSWKDTKHISNHFVQITQHSLVQKKSL